MPTAIKPGPLALAASLVVALAVPASSAEKAAEKPVAKPPADAVAVVGGEPITAAQFGRCSRFASCWTEIAFSAFILSQTFQNRG